MKTFNKVSASVLTVAFLIGISALPVSVLAANAVEYGLITAQITASDLGVDSVGTLPTSPFYFLKQWSRGIQRLFTFGPTAKAELELNIENQTAAEVYEVVNSDPSDVAAIQTALQNLTGAQERLNTQLSNLTGTSTSSERNGNLQIADLLKNADEKTALHAALLEQLNQKFTGQPEYATLLLPYFEVDLNNVQKTFTATIDWGGGSPDKTAPTGSVSFLKQKAADEIAKATTVYGQAVTFTATVTANAPGAGTPTRANVHINNDGLGQAEAGISDVGARNLAMGYLASAKKNLDSAKAAFAAGNYGEAYGLARSAEAVAGVRVAVGDVNGDGKPDLNVKQTSPATSSKPSTKVLENESPRPTDRVFLKASTAATSTPEKGKTGASVQVGIESTTSEPASQPDAGKPAGNPMAPNPNQGAAGSPAI